MGVLLGGTATGARSILGLGSDRRVPKPGQNLDDFKEGLQIVEIINGKEAIDDAVTLAGSFMPLVPFEFGGTQQIVKEFYPGNAEPSIQVLGPREADQTIKGVLKEKRLDSSLEGAAVAYQEALDLIRIRGNVIRVTLGEWKRYAILEETKFRMTRLSEIEYEIRLSIIGFKAPTDCKFVDEGKDPLTPNRELISRSLEALLAAQAYPDSMPQSLADEINSIINGVAEVVKVVTSFVDSAIADIETLSSSANRALGMIKYARAYISKANRQLGSFSVSFLSLGSQFSSEAQKTAAFVRNLNYLSQVKASNQSLASQLAEIQKKFANLARTVPLFRHRVVEGDTLQKLSARFYGTADNWKRIQDHNRLESTNLAKGSVLEIPKL